MSPHGTSDPPRTCPSCGREISAGEKVCLKCSDTLRDAPPPERPTALVVKEIAGFQILQEIGAGGMGTVYEAFDRRMQRRVALKVLSRHHSASEKAATRFAREAWIGGKLSHPNLVKVYEQGTWEELSFFSMEIVGGGSLHDLIVRMKQAGRDERLGLEFGSREYVTWVITQIASVARALDYAHRRGVVHRDVKPMNLLLGEDPPAVKIGDFGLALDADVTRLTTSGDVLGTLAYMAPEQIRGRPEEIDARTDVYAVGVTLFQLLTLQLPFQGESREAYVSSVLTKEARRPSRLNERVSRDLDIVIRKTLEKNPADRYESAAALADDLENVLRFQPIRALPPTVSRRVAKWARRNPLLAALLCTALIALSGFALFSVRDLQQQRLIRGFEIQNLWTRGRAANLDRRLSEAASLLSDLLRRDPDHVKGLYARSLVYLSLARAETDRTERSRLESLAIKDASRIIDLAPRTSWPYALRAYVLTAAGKPQEAATDRATARTYRSSSPSPDDLQFDGILALESGEYEEAVDFFSELITREPDRAEARLNRASAYERLGSLTRAITDYEVAAALTPKSWFPHYQLGRLRTVAGDPEEGRAHHERALELDPENPNVYTGLSNTLLLEGTRKGVSGDEEGARQDFKRAEREARKALELDPSLTWAHLNLGASLIEQNALLAAPDPNLIAEALAEYDRVIELCVVAGADAEEEVYASVMINKCDALIAIGDLSQALESCRAAVDVGPEDPIGHYNLAGVYALMGHPDEALQALERDFELGDRDHLYLSADPWFDSLRGDPRFQSLLERMREASRR